MYFEPKSVKKSAFYMLGGALSMYMLDFAMSIRESKIKELLVT